MLADIGTKPNTPALLKRFKYWGSGERFLPSPSHVHYKLLQKKSEVYFWISDDQYNLPLCIETKVRLSKIKIELKNVYDHLNLK